MAKALNLATSRDGETIRVSWMDTKANDQSGAAGVVIPLIGVVMFFIGSYMLLAEGSWWMLLFSLVFTVVGAMWFRGGSTSFPNAVSFSPQFVTHKGRQFRTEEVTRFEYGVKSALTGIGPKRDGRGNQMSDPSLIRMWINDATAHTISENNWEFSVCHKIRDALDRALTTVRQAQAEAEHVEKYGVQDDKGMPEY